MAGSATLEREVERALTTAKAAARTHEEMLLEVEENLAELLRKAHKSDKFRDDIAAVVRRDLEWTKPLPVDDIVGFLHDMREAARESRESGSPEPMSRTLHEWEVTAGVHGNPDVLKRLHAATDYDGPVERPAV